jgi:hypothetical protein
MCETGTKAACKACPRDKKTVLKLHGNFRPLERATTQSQAETKTGERFLLSSLYVLAAKSEGRFTG